MIPGVCKIIRNGVTVLRSLLSKDAPSIRSSLITAMLEATYDFVCRVSSSPTYRYWSSNIDDTRRGLKRAREDSEMAPVWPACARRLDTHCSFCALRSHKLLKPVGVAAFDSILAVLVGCTRVPPILFHPPRSTHRSALRAFCCICRT